MSANNLRINYQDALSIANMNIFTKAGKEALLMVARVRFEQSNLLNKDSANKLDELKEIESLLNIYLAQNKKYSPDYYELAGRIKIQQGEMKEAVKFFEDGYKKDLRSLEVISTLIQSYQMQYQELNINKETKELKQLLNRGDLDQREYVAKLRKLEKKLGMDKKIIFDRLIDLYKERVNTKKDSDIYKIEYASILFQNGQKRSAIKVLSHLDSNEALLSRLELNFEKERTLENVYQKVGKRDLDANQYLRLIELQDRKNDRKNVINSFENALKVSESEFQKQIENQYRKYLDEVSQEIIQVINAYDPEEDRAFNEEDITLINENIESLKSVSLEGYLDEQKEKIDYAVSKLEFSQRLPNSIFNFLETKPLTVLYAQKLARLKKMIKIYMQKQKEINQELEDVRHRKSIKVISKKKMRFLDIEERILVESFRALMMEIKGSWNELENLGKGISSLVENEDFSKLEIDTLTDIASNSMLEFLPLVKFEASTSNFNRLSRSIYEGVINMNHHPEYVFRAYLGVISGLLDSGNLKDLWNAKEKFDKFEKLRIGKGNGVDGYFDGLNNVNISDNNGLIAYLKMGVNSKEFSVNEVVSLADIYFKKGEFEVARRIIKIVQNQDDLSEKGVETISNIKKEEKLKKFNDVFDQINKKDAKDLEYLKKIEKAKVDEDKKSKRMNLKELEKHSKYLKWLAVQVGSYKPSMAHLTEEIRHYTKDKNIIQNRKMKYILDEIKLDQQTKVMVEKFHKDVIEQKSKDARFLSELQDKVFEEIYKVDRLLLEYSSKGTYRVYNYVKVVNAGYDVVVDLSRVRDTKLTPFELTTIAKEFVSIDKRFIGSGQNIGESKIIVLLPEDNIAIQRDLRFVGLGRIDMLYPKKYEEEALLFKQRKNEGEYAA